MIRLVAAVIAVLYLGYGAVMIVMHARYIYPFSPEVFSSQDFHTVAIPTEGAVPLMVSVHRASRANAPVVVYFMGNLGALGYFQPIFDLHLAADRTIVTMAFRGGGGQGGEPSEVRLKADALATFDALPLLAGDQHGPVFVQGYSLGTGLALHVASQRKVAGLVLDAPYARLCEVMAQRAWLPACLMPFVQKWQSVRDVGGLTAPVLILHGTADLTIPIAQGLRLAAAIRAAGGKVGFQALEGGRHDNLIDVPPYADVLNGFIATGALPEG